MKKIISVTDIGEKVFCDASCGKEYTNSDECGGILFGSYAYCPTCTKEALPRIKSYGEEHLIKAICPSDMTFKDFCLKLRGGNNKIIEMEVNSLEDLKK